MNQCVVICSMLHEEDAGSAQRRFRSRPVLEWTLNRVRQASTPSAIAMLCWDEQQPMVNAICEPIGVTVITRGPRHPSPKMSAVSAARRWSDGWRGGLMQTCDFDAGFDAAAVCDALETTGSEVAVLVDPSAALIDPRLLDALHKRIEEQPETELFFMPAAPGLGAAAVRRSLVEKFAITQTLPGKWLHYLPDQPSRDPIAGDGCVTIPTSVARTTHNFRFDSARQIERMTRSLAVLNGQLITSDAGTIIRIRSETQIVDRLPRELTLELNTNRRSSPIFRPASIERPAMTRDLAATLLDELADAPDVRLTLAGCGDPLESEIVFDVLEMATHRGIRAVHLETDLLCEDEDIILRLATMPLDVLTVHLPAATIGTYAAVMGVDRLTVALQNIATLVTARAARNQGVPLIVPTFMKCRQNLAEMEVWYDQWIRALGHAVISGPSDFAGQIADVSVGDMSPPRRRACRRIQSRATILSDGRMMACEQDFAGTASLGRIGESTLSDLWTKSMRPLRDAHGCGNWSAAMKLCGTCREWNRP